MSDTRIRLSQIVGTFGPGALVDLTDRAVLVAGLEHWIGRTDIIAEPRLLSNLRRRLDLPALELRSPPVPERDDQPGSGLAAWQFPEWFLAQYEQVSKEFGRSRPLLHRRKLVKGRYVDTDSARRKRKDWPVVPVRFVQGCPNGHISDIDWPRLIHEGASCGGQLWIDERGTTGDLAELFLRCDGCDRDPVSLVTLQGTRNQTSVLGSCLGQRLWLGLGADEPCRASDGNPHPNKLLIRHASNAYFPILEHAISIPDHNERVRKAVDALWDDYLAYAESPDDIRRERRKARVQQALEGLTDQDVWLECEKRRSADPGAQRSLKDAELDTFLSVPDELGDDTPDGDFYARRLNIIPASHGPMASVERVVLVHRLREVVAQIGFTRFDPIGSAVDAEVDLGVRVASLSREPRWLPAVQNRGEGIFIELNARRVNEWIGRPGVKRRASEFLPGIRGSLSSTLPREHVERVYMPYIMLHSLSHLLLTSIALECGYATVSLRERIYLRSSAYGILIYTGSPDAEGTLGGLAHVGRRLKRHLEDALELGRLCSNDPVCAQHHPNSPHETRPLHGAACHGCLLIAEPSCERRNELLDRSLVVPSIDTADIAFFSG